MRSWYFQSEDKARALSREHGYRAIPVNLADADATRARLDKLGHEEALPDVLIHWAGVVAPLKLEDIGLGVWQEAIAVNGQAAFCLLNGSRRRGARISISFS